MKTFNAYVMTITALLFTVSLGIGIIALDKKLCVISSAGLVLWYMAARVLVFLYGEEL